jgi:hypothetical protein
MGGDALLFDYPLRLCGIPTSMDEFLWSKRQHFSKYIPYYNNMESFAAVAVDNNNGGGWGDDTIRGDSAVTLYGRTYHFSPKSSYCKC